MTWIRLTVHWIVSDCDLGKVSVYTPSRGCVGLHVVRTIQVLEDMLRACVLDHKGSWEEHFPLVELAYNNSYQASIQMASYEALYGRPCRSPLCWIEVGESSITGPDLIRDTSEKVNLIRQRLLMAQSRQKSYPDVRRRPLEFKVGGHVFLKVMLKRGVVRMSTRPREAITEVYWAFRDTREGRHYSVPVGFTAQHVKCPRGISRLHAPGVYSRSSSCSGLGRD